MKKIAFTDGIVSINSVVNSATAGNKPQKALTQIYKVPFARQKVGIIRYYQALQAKIKISDTILIPILLSITAQHIAVIDSVQYTISQVQHDKNSLPHTTVLSLTLIEV